jgi:DNA replication initiation complex subunit (GINS family)
MNAKRTGSCRQIFKIRIHNINSRFSSALHTTLANLTNLKNAFQKDGVRIEGKCAGR